MDGIFLGLLQKRLNYRQLETNKQQIYMKYGIITHNDVHNHGGCFAA